MVQILRREVESEGELDAESSEFNRGLLMNIRLKVDLEPSGHPPTDALHAQVLNEVAVLLAEIEARTRSSLA